MRTVLLPEKSQPTMAGAASIFSFLCQAAAFTQVLYLQHKGWGIYRDLEPH